MSQNELNGWCWQGREEGIVQKMYCGYRPLEHIRIDVVGQTFVTKYVNTNEKWRYTKENERKVQTCKRLCGERHTTDKEEHVHIPRVHQAQCQAQSASCRVTVTYVLSVVHQRRASVDTTQDAHTTPLKQKQTKLVFIYFQINEEKVQEKKKKF